MKTDGHVRFSRETPGRSLTLPVLVLRVVAPFFFGYFVSYVFRAVNAAIAPDLVNDLSLSGAALGLLTAAYLMAFVASQLPLGMLFDRFGPARVQGTFFLLAALGAFLFSRANTPWMLTFARALIGLGCAGALMAGFKAVADHAPPPRRALFNALVMSAGGLGLLVAATPVRLMADALGWRNVFVVLAGLSLLAAFLLWTLAIPEKAHPHTASMRERSISALLSGLVQVLSSSVFWRLAPLAALTSGSQIAIQTLWAGPWFTEVAGLDARQAAGMLSLMAVGFFAGTLVNGFVADRLAARGIGSEKVMLGFAVVFMLAELPALIGYTGPGMALSWFLVPLAGQTGILAYPALAAHFGVHMAGRSNSALNLMVFIVAFFAQWMMGVVLDIVSEGVRPYPVHAFSLAFGMLLLAQLAAFLWYLVQPRLLARMRGRKDAVPHHDSRP